jgi:hypothetical protein
MEKEAKNICESCQFEHGEHSQSCPKYKEVELEMPKEIKKEKWEKEFDEKCPKNDNLIMSGGEESKMYGFGYKRKVGNEIITVTDWARIKKFINKLETKTRAEAYQDGFKVGKKWKDEDVARTIKETKDKAIKETLKGIREGTICLSCGKKKESNLSDWCDDCLEKN